MVKRRSFFSLAGGAIAASGAAFGQIAGRVANDDDHGGMRMSNVDGATGRMRMAPVRGIAPKGVVPVVTRSYDNLRSGVNPRETRLTPRAVQQKGLTKLFSVAIPDDARGCEAQPLIVPGVQVAGVERDVLIVCSMANSVRAFDANTGAPLWVQRLGRPVTGSKSIDFWQINDHWGILGTPVVDAESGTLYCIAWSSPDGSAAKAVHTLHALKVANGLHARPPLSLEGASYDPGHGLPVQRFQGAARKQRAALVLTNVEGRKTVFAAFGTVLEVAASARGWVIACDVATHTVAAAWCATARYSGGGIWMAGQGLAADEHGSLYAMTGNGSFDGVTEFGECFVKLRYTPAQGKEAARITVVDWWSPFSDSGRAGGDQTADHITKDEGGGWDDMDLGSGGVALMPWLNCIAGAGKDGVLYVLNEDDLGKTMPADFGDPARNYAKLKSPPIWFTYYPGDSVNPAPQHFRDLNFLSAGRTHHAHSTPVVFRGARGTLLYCWGENSNLRAWEMDAKGHPRYLACSAETASPESPVPPGGMPGGMMCLSANGTEDAIVWACVPLEDANKKVSKGVLYAYDATKFGTFSDGSGAMQRLWQSPQYTFNKFNVPVVSGGKVYVPTYDGKVDVYGLNA